MIHVPHGHVVSLIAKQRAGWLRARVTDLAEGQPAYSASPNIKGLEAITIGGTVDAVNAELVTDEEIGISEGVPGQRFLLKRGPVVPGDDDPVLEVAGDEGWDEWTYVPDFAASGPDDTHFTLDLSTGEVRLGPAVRLADGALRHYGAVPAKGAHLRLRAVPDRRRPQAATSRRARSACSSRRSRSCRASRTGVRPGAASTARTSRTPRSAGRSGCAPAAGR